MNECTINRQSVDDVLEEASTDLHTVVVTPSPQWVIDCVRAEVAGFIANDILVSSVEVTSSGVSTDPFNVVVEYKLLDLNTYDDVDQRIAYHKPANLR